MSAEAEGPMGWVPAPSVDNSRAVQALLIALSGEWKITDQLTMKFIQDARPKLGRESTFVDSVNKLLVHGPVVALSRIQIMRTISEHFVIFVSHRVK